MNPALTPGHVVVQSAETLVPGKSRVALSRQSQIPAAVIPVEQVPVPEALTPVAANRARRGTRNVGALTRRTRRINRGRPICRHVVASG